MVYIGDIAIFTHDNNHNHFRDFSPSSMSVNMGTPVNSTNQIMNKLFRFQARVVKVVDADTIDLIIDLGFRLNHEIRVRLFGINAPEKNAPGGMEATNYVKGLLPVGTEVTIQTFKNPTDKYGRWLATVYMGENLVSVNLMLLDKGYAVPFAG